MIPKPQSILIRRHARQLRVAEVGSESILPTPVVEIANTLGYAVHEFDPKATGTPDVSGAVNHDQKRIYVNETEPGERKRYVIAYAIGCIVFYGGEGVVIYRKDINGFGFNCEPRERDANEFAAELLMPPKFFEAAWSVSGGDIAEAASIMLVSKIAASMRVKSLGIGRND